jgi:endonuclease III
VADSQAALALFREAQRYSETTSQREVEWLRTAQLALFDESDFLRESAWVILCSGFREAVVRRRFDFISLAFCDWESAESIVKAADACTAAAGSSFGNSRKLEAIVSIARIVQACGFEKLKSRILEEPVTELRKLPYIGPVTAWHLAKNLGADVAKPDRHMARLARALGYASVHVLCADLASVSGETVRVVDVMLWRYLVDRRKHDLIA